MDKEPSLWAIWSWALPGAVLTYALARRLPLLGLLAVLLATRAPISAVVDLLDPAVGPAMLREAGRGYGAQAYAALTMVLVSLGAGTAAWWRERQEARRRSTS
jgi:hypothetical protein